jgi:putative transposase
MDQVVDRSDRPWDNPNRRPSHADRRRKIALEMLRNRFMAELPRAHQTDKIVGLFDELLCLAAYRQEHEKANRPDQIWATDLMYLKIGQEQYFVVAFIDEYSRYLVHHEVVTSMDAITLSTAAQTALQTLPMDADDRVTIQPIIRSDNGSGYVSREFGELLAHHGQVHHRIRPHCPEENGVMERANRTIREKLDEHEVNSRKEAEEVLKAIISNYNNERLHSSLGFKTPATCYCGNPDALDQARRQKLREARHRRKEENLRLKQRNFPFSATEDVA